MTKMLEQAFAEASKLSAKEQEALARWLLEELTAESHWKSVLDHSQDRLQALADEAVAEHRKGRTQTLDPDRL